METYYARAVKRINNINTEQYMDISNKRYEEIRSRGEYEADAILIAEYYRRVGVLLQQYSKEAVSFMLGMRRLITDNWGPIEYEDLYSICPNLEPVPFSLIKITCFNYLIGVIYSIKGIQWLLRIRMYMNP